MSQGSVRIAGMPYVAGLARGVVQRGMAGAAADRIVVLEQSAFEPSEHLPAGFVVVDGAPFSHGMVPLLGSGVPTVIVSTAQAEALSEGMELILDGSTGHIASDLGQFKTSCASSDVPPVTRDGVAVTLRASARNAASARRAAACGAEAIGLVRSEFLLPRDDRIPDRAFYQREFHALFQAAAPLPVTVRLIDIACDKHPAWLPPLPGATGTLGLQGVRLFAHEPVHSVYCAQLAAIDALSAQFELSLLLPYVSSGEELLYWSDQTRRRLTRPLPLGAMAETPASALQLADWLDIVDFVGVGCNDLMQCLFGADRDQAELRAYLDPYAPALYRFLRELSASAAGHLQRVQLCGVLPQLPGVLPILLGLGFCVFSVEALSLGYLRQVIASTSTIAAGLLAAQVCAASTSLEVRNLLASAAAPA